MNYNPGWLQNISGFMGACPPRSNCCCDQQLEVKPGERVCRFLDMTDWITTNFGEHNLSDITIDPEFVSWQFTDMGNATVWPASPEPPVLPFTVATYLDVISLTPYNGDKDDPRRMMKICFDIPASASDRSRLRLDYTFTVSNKCGEDGRGMGCVEILINKC